MNHFNFIKKIKNNETIIDIDLSVKSIIKIVDTLYDSIEYYSKLTRSKYFITIANRVGQAAFDAASSGALVDRLNGDWGIFFILTAIMVIPSLIFLYIIKDKINLND